MAAIDLVGRYCLNAMFMIVGKDSHTAHYYELLGILNSTYIRYFWKNNFSDKRKTFPKIKGTYLELLPIPVKYESPKIKELILEILHIKQKNVKVDISGLEKEIDRLIYTLYGLTEEEIAIVEGKTQ